jgi:hypothetical protein
MAKAKAKTEAPKEEDSFGDIDALINKVYDDVIDLSKTDTEVKVFYNTGVYALNYLCSKHLDGGIPKGRISGIDGLSGCLSADTIVTINRGKKTSSRNMTVKDLYLRFNGKQGKDWDKNIPTKTFSLNSDGYILLNEIEDVFYSGEQQTYTLTTESGKKITATNTHPFKVPEANINGRGIAEKDMFVPLSRLEVGEVIYCKASPNSFKKNTNKGRAKGRNETNGVKFHPYAWQKKTGKYEYKRIHTSRLVVEANMNELDVNEFIFIVKNDPIKSQSLKFLTMDYVVHHINHDPTDDRLPNLKVMTKKDHDDYHSQNDKAFSKFGHNYYSLEKIVSITPDKIQDTYDIKMKGESKNFIANGIVVHNTGKSLMVSATMRDPRVTDVIVLETEGGGSGAELVKFAGVDPKKVKFMKVNTLKSYKISKKSGKMEEIKDAELPAKGMETETFFFVEGAISKMRKLCQAISFNKEKFKDRNILVVLDSLGNLASVRSLSGCYHPDTLLEVMDENKNISLKKIKDCNEGDRVLTHLGSFELIEKVHNLETKELIEIETELGDVIKLTPNHPMLVERNNGLAWIKAKDLLTTDALQSIK